MLNHCPSPDLHTLGDEQLRTAEDIFNELRDMDLKPAFIADVDPNRALLDRWVLCDLLGFNHDVYDGVRRLSAKCAPSLRYKVGRRAQRLPGPRSSPGAPTDLREYYLLSSALTLAC